MADPVEVVQEAFENEGHPHDFNMWGPREFAECAVRALRRAGHLPAEGASADQRTDTE